MNINTTENGEVKIIKIIGKLDGSSAEQAENEISKSLQNNVKLVMDMSECDYISSAGLRILLITGKELKNINGHAVLSGLVEDVKDVMEMTGFDHIFKNFKGIDEAIEAVKEGE